MPYFIERNGHQHGPYDIESLKKYVEDGLILLQDKIHDTKGANLSVRDILKLNRINVKVNKNGNVLNQVKNFGTKLLIPKDAFSLKNLKSDKRCKSSA